MNPSHYRHRNLSSKRAGQSGLLKLAALILSIAVILISFPANLPLAMAAGPGPLPPGPKLPTGGKLCMNYGHETTGRYDMTQVNSDFSLLKKVGITCLRLAYRGVNNPESQKLALKAKSMGIAVIMGGDSEPLGWSDLDHYDAEAIDGAKWAQANGIPQISIGNEQEYELNGISQDDWVEHLKELATKVHKVYAGKVSYETSSDFLPVWKRHGLGSINILGINNYCGASCNAARVVDAVNAFGYGHVYVSETNADMETGRFNDDAVHAARVTTDVMNLLKTYPVPVYYFNFRSGAMSDRIWGLYDGSRLAQPLTAAVLGIRF